MVLELAAVTATDDRGVEHNAYERSYNNEREDCK